MWTPPPQSLVDAVRAERGQYDEAEVVMAWNRQTEDGRQMGVVILLPTYDDIDQYLTRNKISTLALQIDTMLAESLDSFRESLMNMHEEECYDEHRFKAIQDGKPLPHSHSDHYRACAPAWDRSTGRMGCTYEPDATELASELELETDTMAESIEGEDVLASALESMQAHPRYRRIMSSLKYYATNRRALAEALERRGF